MKKGDIVKVIRPDVGFMGLTSELTDDPQKIIESNQYCFKLLYDSASVDKSNVRRFYGSNVVQLATEGEKALYKFMKSLYIDKIIGVEILAKSLHSNLCQKYIIKDRSLNLYNGCIYVFAKLSGHVNEEHWVELYNGRIGSWASYLPEWFTYSFQCHFINDYFDDLFVPKHVVKTPAIPGQVLVTSTPKGDNHWINKFNVQDIGMDPSILLL